MSLPEALSNCLVLNTVAAARVLVRRYDAQLKPYGVTVQQFALMAAIRFGPGEAVAVLAKRVQLDRTSLIRSLDLLERKGLAQRTETPGRNTRLCHLTAAGDELLDHLLVRWQQGQAGLLTGRSAEETDTFLTMVRHLAR